MSDMSTQRITIRVPSALRDRLRSRSRSNGQTPSEIIRAALENYLDHGTRRKSAYDLAKEAGIIGCATGGPDDLSTNPRHMEGFGKSK
jgi:predicted DNA-binding protein